MYTGTRENKRSPDLKCICYKYNRPNCCITTNPQPTHPSLKKNLKKELLWSFQAYFFCNIYKNTWKQKAGEFKPSTNRQGNGANTAWPPPERRSSWGNTLNTCTNTTHRTPLNTLNTLTRPNYIWTAILLLLLVQFRPLCSTLNAKRSFWKKLLKWSSKAI